MSMQGSPSASPPALTPLSPSNRIEEEMIIGLYPLAEAPTTAAIQVPSRESILRGVGLSVSEPGGNQITDPNLTRRISDELGQLLGGWFSNDLTPYIQLRDSLVPQQLQEYYRSVGMTAQLDKPKTAFYYLAFEVPPWQVQVIGESDTFHAIFLGHLLTQAEAIGEGGHPVVRPLGSVDSVLTQAVPNIARRRFVDETAKHPRNVFDTFLVDKELTVKAGVRMRLAEGAVAFPGDQAYFYGIRINLDLR